MIYIYFIIFNGGEAPATSHILLVKDKKLKQTSSIISVIVVAKQISVLFFGILAENHFKILAQSPQKSLNALSLCKAIMTRSRHENKYQKCHQCIR